MDTYIEFYLATIKDFEAEEILIGEKLADKLFLEYGIEKDDFEK